VRHTSSTELPEQLHLSPGGERRFLLPRHTGGYRWEARSADDCVSARVDYDEVSAGEAPRTPGTSVPQVLIVTAVRPGTAVLDLAEKRSWEAASIATHSLEVIVTSTDDSQKEQP
jgi:predicted secreted protein